MNKKNKIRPRLSESQIPEISVNSKSKDKDKSSSDKKRPSVKDKNNVVVHGSGESKTAQDKTDSTNVNIASLSNDNNSEETSTVDAEPNLSKNNKTAKRKSVKDDKSFKKSYKKTSSNINKSIDNNDSNIKEPNKKKISIVKIVLVVLLLAVIILVSLFTWNRWFKYDDAADIVGTWKISNSNASIVIDNKTIHLNADTNLNYEVDSFAKIITFKTGAKSGVCHYRFSDNRLDLAMIEQDNLDAMSTCFSDIGWEWDKLTCSMNGAELSPAYTIKNKDECDLTNTGIDDIAQNGSLKNVLLEKLS